MKEIKVVELFAGVGGFRLGLEKASKQFKIVWSNQWEPSTKTQHASDIYVKHFGGGGHSNEDITTVPTFDIPDHNMLVGGFPCQDYSVARTLKQSAGLEGKKGVLWWQIHRILKDKKKKPEFLLLENVDRLLKSPVKQRGRDFAIMLASLSDLGYIVEWRVVNAADYGMPQRRRRIFLLAYHKTSNIHKDITAIDARRWISEKGIIAETFPIKVDPVRKSIFKIEGELADVSAGFNGHKDSTSPFENAGIIIERKVHTIHCKPNYNGPFETLGGKILLNGSVPKEYFVDNESISQWEYLKGAKSAKRVSKATGFEYNYSEGAMVFPDPLDKPARTIITGEGGSAPSRFKHVIRTDEGLLRRLMPLELERLNMFPDNHTEGVSDIKRAFFMGNALVVGIVEKIGRTLIERLVANH